MGDDPDLRNADRTKLLVPALFAIGFAIAIISWSAPFAFPDFHTAPDWHRAAFWPAVVAALGLGACGFCAPVIPFFIVAPKFGSIQHRCAMALLGMIAGEALVLRFTPLILTLLLSQPTTVIVIADRIEWNAKTCANAVYLREPSPLGARLCDLPADLLSSLRPGDQLALSGPGSVGGVFVEAVGRAR